MNRRTAKIVKREDGKPAGPGVVSGKISVSDVLAKFDELWRIEHSELISELKAKEKKVREVREMIAALEN
jgi:hypothetical protein